jgi:hypothetical protein
MLHRIQHLLDNPRIQRFVVIQESLIDFICHPDNPMYDVTQPNLKAKIDAACNDSSVAIWLSDRRRKTIRDHISSVVKYLVNHPDERDILYAAFQNDYGYYQRLDDLTFRFQYSSLSANLRSLVEPLFLYLYEYLGDDGYPDVVMFDSAAFNRADYIALFDALNPKLLVCPMCDGKKPDIRNGRRLSDLDHFLPKSKYPFLAIHPRNLVPVCLECNERIKGDQDPLTHNESVSLTNSFHPFTRIPAIELISVSCGRTENGEAHITIEDREQEPRSVRIQSLDRILGLEERWTGRLGEIKESLYDKISGWLDNFTSSEESENEIKESIRLGIEGDLDRIRIGRQQNRVIYGCYLTFVLNDEDEFSTILSDYT